MRFEETLFFPAHGLTGMFLLGKLAFPYPICNLRGHCFFLPMATFVPNATTYEVRKLILAKKGGTEALPINIILSLSSI